MKPLQLQQMQPQLDRNTCEYLTTGDGFYRQLIGFDGMLLHASAVIMDGWAYLFSAPSGTGKSTHTALWQQIFGEERARILNDDKPALRLENGRFYAYGTPWSGKTPCYINQRARVGGIIQLSQAHANKVRSLSLPEKYANMQSATSGLKIDHQMADYLHATIKHIISYACYAIGDSYRGQRGAIFERPNSNACNAVCYIVVCNFAWYNNISGIIATLNYCCQFSFSNYIVFYTIDGYLFGLCRSNAAQ